MVYNVLVNQINNTMYLMLERIVCSDIILEDNSPVTENVEIVAYLNENDSVFNDYKTIKQTLEKKLDKKVHNFIYHYKRS